MSGSTSSGGGGARGAGVSGVNGAGGANAGGGAGRGDWYVSGLRGAATALEFAGCWNQAPSGRSSGREVEPRAAGGARGESGGGAGYQGHRSGPDGGGPIPSLTPLPNANYDAELWLVHTPPGGSEETQHLAVHVAGDGGAAAFSDLDRRDARRAVERRRRRRAARR